MWIINNFHDFEECKSIFADVKQIGMYKQWAFKKKVTELSLYYALFENDRIIAYYWLMVVPNLPNTYKGHELHVSDDHQGQGIATFLYKHILLEDKHIVISDHYHTTGSSYMWDKMRTMPELEVGTFNELTNKIDFSTPDKAKVYGNDYMHFIVKAK